MVYADYAKIVLREIERTLLEVGNPEIEHLIGAVLAGGRIFCDGTGRSGLQADSFAMRLAQMGFTSYVVSETTTPSITENDLLFICSGSGETSILVEHAKRAEQVGAAIALVTAAPDSTLGNLASVAVILKAQTKGVKDQSIQPMGTLFEQSLGIFMDIMVLFLMQEMRIGSEDMFRNHKNLE